jgi:hypothetical protein
MAQTTTERLAPTPEKTGDVMDVRPGADGRLCIERVTTFESRSATISRRGAALVDVAFAGVLMHDSDVASELYPEGAASLAEVDTYA